MRATWKHGAGAIVLALIASLACGEPSAAGQRAKAKLESLISGQPQGAPGSAAAQPASAAGDAWSVQYKPVGGVLIKNGGANIVETETLVVGPELRWQPRQELELPPEGDAERFGVRIPGWGAELQASVRAAGQDALAYTYDLTMGDAPSGIVGGGLQFRIHYQVLGRRPGMKFPELLPDDRGFRWQVDDGRVIEVAFDKPIASVSSEPNRPDIIRCFFIGERTKPGKQRFTMTVRVPKGGTVRKSIESQYAPRSASWHADTLLWDRHPVDLRFLNASDRPAGSHGFVQAKGDALVFADGTPARFWGTNLQAGALFANGKEVMCAQAERIAAFGFNLVRLHHHDVDWMKANVFDRSGGTTQKLDAASMEKLDWWIKCLADQGVYVWIDLHVGRMFEPGDGVPGASEVNKQQQGKGLTFVNPKMEQLLQKFGRDYLGHVNAYRGKRYADDPAVAAVLITNENDLSTHFVHRMLPGRGAPEHGAMLEKALETFARERGLSPVPLADLWQPGLATIEVAGVESAWFARALRDLKSAGVRVPIATTSAWGNSSYALLPSLALGGIVDVHSYGEAEYITQDPRSTPTLLSFLAGSQVFDKPMSVSEWALEQFQRDRFLIPMHFAALAALQTWDMPIHFTYQQVPFGPPQRVQLGSASYDPGTMAMLPAAALLFRRGDVSPARKTYVLLPSRKDVYEDRKSAVSARAARTLAERSRVMVAVPDIPELAVDDGLPQPRAGAALELVRDLERDFIGAGQTRTVSDTGELMHDFSAGYHTIDTPRTQAAGGWIGGREIALANVVFELRTPKVSIAVTSFDGEPLASSKQMLLSAAAQVAPEPDGRLPFRAEPVEGEIVLRGVRPGLQLVPIMPDATRGTAISGETKGAVQRFRLPQQVPTHWFMLEAPQGSAARSGP